MKYIDSEFNKCSVVFLSYILNYNASYIWGYTPIERAASHGHEGIVKILAPYLTDNPNAAPDNDGETPIEVAKNTKIRRILESFKTSTIKILRVIINKIFETY